MGQQPEAEHVDQRVALVGRVEDDLAADRRHADGVAVVRRRRDTTPSAIHRLRGSSSGPNRNGSISAIGRAPMVKMSRRMPPTPVAAPWIRLDGGRVVVALDADGRRDAVADVDDAGVLTRADEHPGRLGREPAQMHARGLVRAVLGPHDRVHRQLEMVRWATEDAPRCRLPRRRSARARGARPPSLEPPYLSVPGGPIICAVPPCSAEQDRLHDLPDCAYDVTLITWLTRRVVREP